MKKFILFLFITLQLAAANKLRAQVDPHFSQYYAYPLWLNPALTGVIEGGDTRVNASFKDQWSGVNGGYKTGGLSIDFRSGDKAGIGFNLINQAAGTAGYNYFGAYGSFGYGIEISQDGFKKLHFGVQAGLINRSFDPSKLQLDNQYNPIIGFDPTLPGNENFATTNATVFDASAGIFYYDSDPQKTSNFFLGFSVAHLTSPKDPFSTDGIASKLPMRITANTGIRIKASENFNITPHLLYIKQQQNEIKAFGAYSELKFDDTGGFVLGGMYRINDAAVADVGYHINTMLIGVSYDFNTSGLKSATRGQGGLEISLSYVFPKATISNTSVLPGF